MTKASIAILCFTLTGCGLGAGANCSPSRLESESCCPELGVDACGAGLSCAALDGRTVATCYLEHSRLGLESCSDDVQCVSKSCSSGKCRSQFGESCELPTGCAPGSVCHDQQCVKTDGLCTHPCNAQSDCTNGLTCVDQYFCVDPASKYCDASGQCGYSC